MPATESAVHAPRQWSGDGPESASEAGWRTAIEKAKTLLPGDLCGQLEDAAAARAIDAYDYGVSWGIGKLPEAEGDAPSEVILPAVQSALERIAALVAVLDERIQ